MESMDLNNGVDSLVNARLGKLAIVLITLAKPEMQG